MRGSGQRQRLPRRPGAEGNSNYTSFANANIQEHVRSMRSAIIRDYVYDIPG